MMLTKKAKILLIVLAFVTIAWLASLFRKSANYSGPETRGPSKEFIVSRFIDLYLAIKSPTKWMGITTQQTPTDLWAVQEIIYEVKPDFIVETGTLKGGSALYFASLLQIVKPAGRIITVDIEDQTAEARDNPLFQKYITFLKGSSVDDEIVSEIHKIVNGGRTIVFLDSDHHAYHVLKEMRAYADLVSVGSYMIVNDTFFHEHEAPRGYRLGPLEAIQKFMKFNKSFDADKSRARFMLSFYPDGYLKRVS
jgi:cephalosporin hydroxylase